MMDVSNKRVAVIGLSRTGVAAARMLVDQGADVVVSDIKQAEELKDELTALEGLPLDYELGGHGELCLNSQLIVVSPGVPLNIQFFRGASSRGIPIISEIELAYQFTSARIIAITGTNGKTTTTGLLGKIMHLAYPEKVRVAGNIGTPLVQEAVGLDESYWLVTEVSSFQLETISEFRPAYSLYLNFSPDHLDRHGQVSSYWDAKKRIFKNQTPEDFALINYDDREVVRASAGCQAAVWGVSLLEEVKRGIWFDGQQLIFSNNGKINYVIDRGDIPLNGFHNVQNAAFAALAALLTGVKPENVREGIINFTPEPHRMEEFLQTADDILFIDDSKATNPDAAVKALQSIDRPLVLIAGGQDRNADFHELARIIREKVKTLILLGETRQKIKEEVLAGGGYGPAVQLVDNMQQAVGAAHSSLSPGDCLLLSPGCPSWDMYSSYKERGREFKQEVGLLGGN